MNRYLISLLLIVSSMPHLFARTITGTIVAEKDSTTLSGAVCKLYTDNQLIKSTTSSDNGNFTIQTDRKTALYLEISLVGFQNTDIQIESGSKNINLGNVFLSETVVLDEVTVTASRIINSKGRTIVYPSAADVKASSSSLSLFQKLPLAGLEANPITRTLSVDRGTPKILINGVPSTIEDFNALMPKDIEKVEYSRFTPARYADSGTSGFINITLKKRNDGGQIYTWGRTALQTAFVDANLRASYHQGPSQFTISYNPSWRNYQKVYDSSQSSYVADNFKVDLKTTDRNPFNYFMQNMNLKYDYSPNLKTLFTATFRATPSISKRYLFGHTEDSYLGEYDIDNKTKSSGFSPSLDLFFRRDFNSKNSLEAQLVGTLTSDDYRRDYRYDFTDGTFDNYTVNVDSRRRSLITALRYIHTFSDLTTLSTGYQNTISRSKNSYLTSDYEPILTENNNYLYANLGQTIGNVYLSLSTGLKLFWMENDLNKRHFIKNLSSARISWNSGGHWNILATMDYSPGIPSLSSLTDYPQQISPYLISNGNPDLKVSDYFNYRIYVTYQIINKFYVTYTTAMQTTHNGVTSDYFYLGNEKFLSQSSNYKTYRCFQNDITLGVNNLAGFGANLYFCYSNYHTAGNGWSHNLGNFDASMSLWWNHGPFTISYWRKVPAKYLSGHYVSKEENGDALSFDYKPNRHWVIGLNWMYMFDKKGTRYPSWSYSSVNPSVSDRYIKHNGNMVVITLSYNTDFGSIFHTARRNLNNSDNAGSILKL